MKVRLSIAALAIAIGGVVVADNHPTGDAAIEARQAAMKAIGAAAKAGDFPAMAEAAVEAQTAFLDDTTADGTVKTEASPTIWTDKENFDAVLGQLIELAQAGDKEVFGTCKSCHGDYRVKN